MPHLLLDDNEKSAFHKRVADDYNARAAGTAVICGVGAIAAPAAARAETGRPVSADFTPKNPVARSRAAETGKNTEQRVGSDRQSYQGILREE